jgi:hypothetical protein
MAEDTAQDTIEFTPPPGYGPQFTEAQQRQMAESAEFQAAAHASRTTGNGEPPTAPVNFRMHPADLKALAAKVQPHGMKVQAGPIVNTPFAPPIDLDPRVVENIDNFEDHKGYLASAQTAFSTAFEGLKKIADARTTAQKNPAWNEWQVLLNVGAFAEKTHLQMCKAFDSAVDGLQKGIDHIDKTLAAPLASSAANPFAREIRDHVKGLPKAERTEFLAQAMNDGDTGVVSALLGAPHYLSGLDKSAHDHHSRKYREQQNPELVGRQTAMRAALDLINSRAHRVHALAESALGGKFATLKRVRDANSAAEKALAIQQAPLVDGVPS